MEMTSSIQTTLANRSATVTNPSGNVIPGQSVTWTIAGTSTGNGTLSTGNGGSASSTNFTGTLPGTVYLTASLSGYSSVTSTITVQAAGPVVDSLSFVPSPGSKGGTATVIGHDNVVLSITSNWSSDPSVTTVECALPARRMNKCEPHLAQKHFNRSCDDAYSAIRSEPVTTDSAVATGPFAGPLRLDGGPVVLHGELQGPESYVDLSV